MSSALKITQIQKVTGEEHYIAVDVVDFVLKIQQTQLKENQCCNKEIIGYSLICVANFCTRIMSTYYVVTISGTNLPR